MQTATWSTEGQRGGRHDLHVWGQHFRARKTGQTSREQQLCCAVQALQPYASQRHMLPGLSIPRASCIPTYIARMQAHWHTVHLHTSITMCIQPAPIVNNQNTQAPPACPGRHGIKTASSQECIPSLSHIHVSCSLFALLAPSFPQLAPTSPCDTFLTLPACSPACLSACPPAAPVMAVAPPHLPALFDTIFALGTGAGPFCLPPMFLCPCDCGGLCFGSSPRLQAFSAPSYPSPCGSLSSACHRKRLSVHTGKAAAPTHSCGSMRAGGTSYKVRGA